jgi:hypothetical protein
MYVMLQQLCVTRTFSTVNYHQPSMHMLCCLMDCRDTLVTCLVEDKREVTQHYDGPAGKQNQNVLHASLCWCEPALMWRPLMEPPHNSPACLQDIW